jgi:hypothetical protein
MSSWETFKKGFDGWEDSTAKVLERVLKSPSFVGPSGSAISAYMRAKAKSEAAKTQLWGDVGVATKLDQERTLHLLNRLESKMLDLEERMEVLIAKLDAAEARAAREEAPAAMETAEPTTNARSPKRTKK